MGRTSLGYRDEYDLYRSHWSCIQRVDEFVNMDIRKKLNKMGIGIVTGECVGKSDIEAQAAKLFKKPFWTFAKEYYGAALSIFKNSMADGMIYLSSFSCGIDSVVTELIKIELGDFPFMVLKLDEHTGEAGYNTRLEAFADMLKRRRAGFDNNLSQYGQCFAARALCQGLKSHMLCPKK